MNRRMLLVVLLCCGFIALAAVGVYAELQKGQYKGATLGQLEQAAPNGVAPNSEYGAISYPLYLLEMEAGDGKAETEGYCSVCHSTRYITMQPPLPPATWEAEVNKMKKTFGATIPDEATTRITHYLQEHYSTGTRKR
ncbi:MAG: hypothetical protein WA789_08145 [Candidatus Acidiferrum sp.]